MPVNISPFDYIHSTCFLSLLLILFTDIFLCVVYYLLIFYLLISSYFLSFSIDFVKRAIILIFHDFLLFTFIHLSAALLNLSSTCFTHPSFLSFRIFLPLVLFVYLPSTHFVASSFPVAFHTSPFSYSTISLLSLIMPPSLVSFNHLSIFLCTPRSFVWFVQPLFPIALYISCFFHSTISLLPLIMPAPLILSSHFRYPFAHFSIRPSPSTHFF